MNDSMDRRHFAKKLVGAVAALGAIASLGAAALWWFWDKARGAVFRKFALVRDLTIGQPKLVSVLVSSASAGPASQISVWLVRRTDDKVDAYSTICPHAGGRLRCRDTEFYCPKHGARFDLQGHRLKIDSNGRANPAPRDMDCLPVQCVVHGGDGPVVEVKYQEFLTGTPKQLPVP